MRLPFLQVPQLDLSRGRTLARILHIPEAHGIGLTVALDAWAVDEAPEGDVSGLIQDPNPAEVVALAVGWDGPHEQLLAALVRVKLVEETPAGPCVVSVRRYESALSAPSRRSSHASIAAYARWHGKSDAPSMSRAMPDDAYTQTQTQTQTEDLPLPSSAARLGSPLAEQKPPTRRAKRPKPEKPTDSRHAPLTEALCEYGGWPHHGGRTAKAISVLLAHADRTPGLAGASAIGEVRRRADIAKASEGYPRVRELHELAERWGHFAEAPRGQGPPRAQDGVGMPVPSTCAGCGANGETAAVGEPEVPLGYACGCLRDWRTASLSLVEALDWAERRRRGAA